MPAPLEPAIPPPAALLPAAEARWQFSALALAARRLNSGHDLVPLLDSCRRNFDIRPVRYPYLDWNTLQLAHSIQLPDTPLPIQRIGRNSAAPLLPISSRPIGKPFNRIWMLPELNGK